MATARVTGGDGGGALDAAAKDFAWARLTQHARHGEIRILSAAPPPLDYGQAPADKRVKSREEEVAEQEEADLAKLEIGLDDPSLRCALYPFPSLVAQITPPSFPAYLKITTVQISGPDPARALLSPLLPSFHAVPAPTPRLAASTLSPPGASATSPSASATSTRGCPNPPSISD